jgi:hypothetical protein
MPKFRVYGTSISEDMFVATIVAGSEEEARRKAENGEFEDIDHWCQPKNTFVVGDVEKVATGEKGSQGPRLSAEDGA